MKRFSIVILLLLHFTLLKAQPLSFSRIFSGNQKNSPLQIINKHKDHFYVLRYNRIVHDLILEKRSKPSADLLRIYPLKLDSVNARWFDYELLDYLLYEDQRQVFFFFEKILNNEVALYMKTLDSSGVMSRFIPVFSQKATTGSELNVHFALNAQKKLQIVSEVNANKQVIRKTVMVYDPMLRQISDRFILPPENAYTGYSQQHVVTPAGQLYFIQTFQEVTGYDRRYTSSGTTVVPRIQTDTVSVVTISKQQVLTRRKLPTPILSSLHYASLISRGPELFFLMHASAKDSLPFFYLARMRTDLALVDYIHTQVLDSAPCKMLTYYDGSDESSAGTKAFKLLSSAESSNAATICEGRSEGNYHKEVLVWKAELTAGRVVTQFLVPRKLFFFPNRTYFRHLNELVLLNDSNKTHCFLLENRANKRQLPQDYQHKRFAKQTQLRHGALVHYQLEENGIKKRLLFENGDFDFVPVRYDGWNDDVVFYFSAGKSERFAILKDYRF